jgi:transposase
VTCVSFPVPAWPLPHCTSIKNRIHSLLAKYNLSSENGVRLFSRHGTFWLESSLSRLPPETSRCLAQQLELLDFLFLQIATLEERIHNLIALTPTMQLLKSLPGVGDMLAVVLEREVGIISRFPSAPRSPKVSHIANRRGSHRGRGEHGHNMCHGRYAI